MMTAAGIVLIGVVVVVMIVVGKLMNSSPEDRKDGEKNGAAKKNR